jgi:hypothetical protein
MMLIASARHHTTLTALQTWHHLHTAHFAPLLLLGSADRRLGLAKLPSGHAALKQLVELAISAALALGEEEEDGQA